MTTSIEAQIDAATIDLEITFALIQMDLRPTGFGLAVANNGRLVRQIEQGRVPRPPMIQRIRKHIANERFSRGLAPVAPRDVIPALEAYLARLRLVANDN